MANLSGVIAELERERTRAAEEMERLDQAMTALSGLNGASGRIPSRTTTHPRKTMSAAARRRIAAAQRARWAKLKADSQRLASPGKVQATATKKAPVRVLSAAARNKIAAAQRARWAKVRAQEPKRKAA